MTCTDCKRQASYSGRGKSRSKPSLPHSRSTASSEHRVSRVVFQVENCPAQNMRRVVSAPQEPVVAPAAENSPDLARLVVVVNREALRPGGLLTDKAHAALSGENCLILLTRDPVQRQNPLGVVRVRPGRGGLGEVLIGSPAIRLPNVTVAARTGASPVLKPQGRLA